MYIVTAECKYHSIQEVFKTKAKMVKWVMKMHNEYVIREVIKV